MAALWGNKKKLAMYTSKHIIPQDLYKDLYIIEVEILADFLLWNNLQLAV